jgi:hypothetical protein
MRSMALGEPYIFTLRPSVNSIGSSGFYYKNLHTAKVCSLKFQPYKHSHVRYIHSLALNKIEKNAAEAA